jgi:hypothetical protein
MELVHLDCFGGAETSLSMMAFFKLACPDGEERVEKKS